MKSVLIHSNTQGSAQPKPYEKPGVITFGSVAKLTRGVGGTKVDTGHNNTTRRGGQ